MISFHKHIIRYKSAPPTWKAFVLLFFILPFVHYTSEALKLNVSVLNPAAVLFRIHPVMIFIIFMPFIIGTAFYLLKRWAWILLTEYSVLLIGFSLYAALFLENKYNVAELSGFFILFASILFANRENVKTAYRKDFMSIPRGWRNSKRYKLNLPVEIFSGSYMSEDISHTGISIQDPLSDLEGNSELPIYINFPAERIPLMAGIARKTENVSGLAFINLSSQDRKKIKKLIKQEKKRRYLESMEKD